MMVAKKACSGMCTCIATHRPKTEHRQAAYIACPLALCLGSTTGHQLALKFTGRKAQQATMSDSIANKDEGLHCLDIARTALKAGDHARAEKFAAKALKLYRCQQVQIFITELGRQPSSSGSGGGSTGAAQQNGSHHQGQPRDHTHHRDRQHQQQQRHQQQQEPGGPSGAGDRSHQQRRQQQQGQQQGQPRGMGDSDGLRHRHSRQQQQQEDPSVTPEQRQVVQQILVAESFYDVLGVAKDAGDADIKAAYRKLALRLHPDKNKALKADEAFKLLSRAFSCLSNPDKRAYYDRTGYESSNAAASAAPARRAAGGGRPGGQQFYYSGPDDFDPEEIFNMFFGAGAFNPHAARVFRTQFGGGPAQRPAAARPPSREEQQRTAVMGLLQLLPVLLLICVTLFSGSSEPSYSLVADGQYRQPQFTQRLNVTFYVKDNNTFTTTFPAGSHKRHTLERQVESDTYERLYQRCQNERMAQHRAYTWGNREAARKMELASCKELTSMNEKLAEVSQGRTATTAGGRG